MPCHLKWQHQKRASPVSGSEWNAAESLVQILKPIADATIDLGGQKYGTLSSAIPFLYGAEQILKRYSAIESEVVAFAKNLLKSLKSRFPLYMEQKELVLATLCDPRFKAIFFSTSSHRLFPAVQQAGTLLPAIDQLQGHPSDSLGDG